jgi:hypothetical protein
MSFSYVFSTVAEKFCLKSPLAQTALDCAVALGWDLLKLHGHCGEFEVSLVLSLSPTNERDYYVDVEGLYIVVDESSIIDQKISALFKYANYIVKEGRRVYFYIKKPYILGAYYITCGEVGVSWSNYSYPSDSDLVYLSDEND